MRHACITDLSRQAHAQLARSTCSSCLSMHCVWNSCTQPGMRTAVANQRMV